MNLRQTALPAAADAAPRKTEDEQQAIDVAEDDDDKDDVTKTLLPESKRRAAFKGPKASATIAPETAEAPRTSKRLRGLAYIVFAGLSISLMSTCIKVATRSVTSHEAVFWRSLLTCGLYYGLIRVNNVDLYVAPQYRVMLLCRSLLGMLFMSLSYYAFSKMVLTDATVIIFTSPVLTFLLGHVLLGEAIDRIDFLCALTSYVGVLFVSRPAMLFPQSAATKETHSIAVLAALGAAATQACAYITMRKLQAVHYMAVSFYFSLFGIGFAIATLWAVGIPLRIPEGGHVQLALAGSAVFSCVGMLALTLGFQLEKAGIASVMRYCGVVFVFLLDTVCLGEVVNPYSVIGGTIILGGAIVIAVRRARNNK